MASSRASFPASRAPLFLAFLGLTLIGAGCSAVLTVEPVGSEPVVLEPEQWDGVWCDLADAAAHLSSVRGDK